MGVRIAGFLVKNLPNASSLAWSNWPRNEVL